MYDSHKYFEIKHPKGSVKPFLFNIYEGLVTPTYKKLLGQNPTVLVTAGYGGEKPPCLRVNPRQVTAMAISSKRNADHPKDDFT